MRGALAASAVALAGAFVAAEYVGAGGFGLVVCAVVGALCGAAAESAAGTGEPGGPPWGLVARAVRGAAAAYAVLGVATAFVLEGSVQPLSRGALPSYAVAALGALLWTAPGAARVRGGAAG